MQISISNLTFAYPGSYDNIFENVSFSIDTNWKLAFIGRNGKGKTTFLNLLLKKYEYSGTISAPITFEYFPYEIVDKSDLTINILQEKYPDFLVWQLMRELNNLEVDEEVLYRPFDTLSFGEQTKVMLALLFLKPNAFLLIDEPTNHLDVHGREILYKYLNTKSGFILVSHDRSFLDGCCDHVLSLNRKTIEIQSGNFSSWFENKQKRDNFEQNQNQKLKKEIARLQNSINQKNDWSDYADRKKVGIDPLKVDNKVGYRTSQGLKAKKLSKRAKAIEVRQTKSIEEKEKLLKDFEHIPGLSLTSNSHHSKTLVELKNVSLLYGDKTVCKGINFSISQGERVNICGKNGSGKSTLLKLIIGNNISLTGTLFVASNLKISYVNQDTSSLCGTLADFAENNGIDQTQFLTILRKLDFSREQFEKDIKDFSGGQKKKVLIAKSLCEQAHLYVWDEPTNFIDIFSRMQIENLLKEYQPTLLFVDHDKTFCQQVATKTINI